MQPGERTQPPIEYLQGPEPGNFEEANPAFSDCLHLSGITSFACPEGLLQLSLKDISLITACTWTAMELAEAFRLLSSPKSHYVEQPPSSKV